MDERRRNQIVIGVVLGAIGCGCLVYFAIMFAIMAAILFPVFVQAGAKAQQVQCISNQKHIALAVMLYTADYHDFFPPTSQWTDAVRPYLGSDESFLCPAARHLDCGYAFYQPLSSRKVKEISQRSSTPMLFDSTEGQHNYADKGQSLAFRHLGGAVVAFADGHVKWLSEINAKQVFKR